MMTDDKLVETMARAMWMADVEPYDLADRIPFEQAPDTAQDYCRAEARAALAAARPVIRAQALEEAAKVAAQDCEKCSGEGWLWAHELDEYHNPDNRSPRADDTRYSCDGSVHHIAAAIRALKEKD